MLLFAISFLMVFASSYFLTSIIAPKKSVLGFIYLFLIAFAQLVLTFEVLSVFTAINQVWVFVLNVLILVGSIYAWHKNYRPIWSVDCSRFKHRVANSFRLDKAILWLYVSFIFFVFVSLFLCLTMPLTSADAQGYHVARSVFWVLQGSLNHFEVADIRNLCLPINSEILYTWVILFTHKALFLGFFSFVGYVLTIVSLYNIMGFLAFSTRKRLWVIFILASLPSVLVQVSGTETDIIIAGLVTSSIYLFWYALKHNKLTPIFMSALAYALAVGTKTTAIIVMPGVGLLMLALSIYYKQIKLLGYFLGFVLFNFLIFSSYNFILNFIHFGNFMGTQSFMVVSKNYYGIKGAVANLIKYLFIYFDFTGLRWADYVNNDVVNLRTNILSSLGLGNVLDGLYSAKYSVNNSLIEPVMGAGVLGLFVYLPCLFWGLLRPIFKSKSKKTWFVFSFALLYLINITVLSYLLAYMSYSVRFIMFFIVLSSPLLAYSYTKRKSLIKNTIVFFAIFYLVFVSTNLWARPISKISRVLLIDNSISHLRYRALCTDFNRVPSYSNSACPLRMSITKKVPQSSRILAFIPDSHNIFAIKTLEFEGYKVDFRNMEDLDKINLDNYEVLISTSIGQRSTILKHYNGFKERDIYDGDIQACRCLYGKNKLLKNVESQNIEASSPFQVTCKFNDDYLKYKHFKLIDKAGVFKPILNDYTYYTLYQKTD